MIRLLLLFPLLLMKICAFAQDDPAVRARIIFIGDAGQIDSSQTAVIRDAVTRILPGKTKVMYLGDNIYPYGMGLKGSAEEEETKAILRSQFVPFRSRSVPVYFTPGNHDWDRSGKNGLAKIKQQSAFLAAQQDSLLRLVPADGCPDPVAIPVTDELTMIAFDSEWWLFPHQKKDASNLCKCNTKEEVLSKLKELVAMNRNKIILLAAHHPFMTYGDHGGYKKIPLVGGLYRSFRSVFPSREDTNHPRYKEMIHEINKGLEGAPNVIHFSGHDHGLQLIKDRYIQVVSGSGAKQSNVVKGPKSLFADSRHGYVTADLLDSRQVKLTFFGREEREVEQLFTVIIETNASD